MSFWTADPHVCLLERDLKDELSEVFMGVEKRKL
jgi:hypothetical protein